MSKTAILRLLPLLVIAGALASCEEGPGILEPGPMQEVTLKLERLEPIDRFGLPAINTVFIPSSRKDEFNKAAPANDQASFRAEVVNKLIAFGNSSAQANALANALLPDIQPINLTQPTAFLNGRWLADDVIDAELGLIFGANANLNSDHVNSNDKQFLSTFPYLAAPHLP